jgi:anti-sigma factor RsiW
MNKPQHLTNDVLVGLLDDELSRADALAAEEHLNVCAKCRQRYHDIEDVSRSVEQFASGISAQYSDSERDELLLLLNTEQHAPARRPQKVLQRFAWAMALAASLAMGVLIAPHFRRTDTQGGTGSGA